MFALPLLVMSFPPRRGPGLRRSGVAESALIPWMTFDAFVGMTNLGVLARVAELILSVWIGLA